MSDNISQDLRIEGEGNIVVGKGNVIINPLPPAEERLRHDLGILLKNVENTWIKGVLEKSVHEAVLLELGMEFREEAVENPWRIVMEKPNQSREVLPQGRKIKDIFDEANRLLLILGEPGSGKTTTLLQLARDLIAEVEDAFTQPVPVVLNLSTWTNKQQPLDEWLIAELNSRYRLPKRDGKKWLRDRRILPLLDGLDEVRSENRADCVEKINQLVDDYGLQGLVVCSRIKDYTDLDVRLAFYRAIYLQPLTSEQVDKYLNQAGGKLANLRATLQADEALQEMARSPLILNIMSLAYEDTTSKSLSDPSLNTKEARSKHLFDTYIARMFKRKAGRLEFNTEQIKQRLSWLARNMQSHKQDVFLIEELQPSWLPSHGSQWIYVFVSRLICGLIVSVTFVAFMGENAFRLIKWLFTAGPFIGLSLGLIDLLRFEWFHKQAWVRKHPAFCWSIENVVAVGLILGLIFGLSVRRYLVSIYWTIPSTSLIFGVIFGLIFGLRGSQQNLEKDIRTVEALHWSERKAVKGGLIGLSGGLIYGLIDAFDLVGTLLWEILLQDGLIFGLIGVILGGLYRGIVETKTTPNEGIQLSIRNAIFGGLILGLIFGVGSGLIGGLGGGLIFGLKAGLFFLFISGTAGAIWYGGFDVLQHYTLRIILVIQGHTPRKYAQFLDYAVDRIFLQKVGGGYRFIHGLLLEHFAEMREVK